MSKYLKTTSVFFVLLFITIQGISQNTLKKALQGEWIKDRISLKDGSTIYDANLLNSSFGLEFMRDSLIISIDGKNSYTSYSIEDSILGYRGSYFKITRLDNPILELEQVKHSDDIEPIRLKMNFKPTYDLGTSPEFYTAKNNDKVYILLPGVLEPKFMNARFSAMDYIFANFKYPEYKKGGFVVRFVVTKEGKLLGQKIMASSNQKYDQKLIDAINKTKGKWLPAKYLGKAVNCEIEYNFDLGWSKEDYSSSDDDKITAEEYESNGRYYFSAKNYRSSVYYFSKAIEKNPYLIDSYYLRAAAHIFLNKTSSACADYNQLKVLNQKRAESLYDKYCQNYTPQSID
ncbi:MAG: hypothetical protein ACI9IP_000497 [Arcticibacterium sp.]|jgi:hypothetical protein